MATVFLTGGTGFLGSRVCRALRQRQHSILFLMRSGSAPAGVEVVSGDLLEPDTYRDALRTADVVVHLAAVTGKATARDHDSVNAQGTGTLVDESRRCGVRRFLFTSTIAVKFPDQTWYDYARAKTRAEEAIRASDVPFTILRPTIMLGPGSATLAALERLARMPIIPVFGDGRARVQPIFVDDVVAFVVAVLDEDRFRGETLELGGPAVLAIEELLQHIRQARTGSRGRTIHIPLGLALASLKFAQSIGLAGVLPLSVGQLSPFRFDSTIDANPLHDSRRAALTGLAQMLA
jgi:nucleoside-diphosphate-sugar epimerase